jgi:hypothetical protein
LDRYVLDQISLIFKTNLSVSERAHWRCYNCGVFGHAVWTVRDGPAGPRVSISFSCHDTNY